MSTSLGAACCREIDQTILSLCRWRPRSRRFICLLGWAIILAALCSVGVYKAIEMLLRWNRLPRYLNKTERNARSERFLSVDQRVQLYMTNWYYPPCNPQRCIFYERIFNTTFVLQHGGWLSKSSSTYDRYYYRVRELDSDGQESKTFALRNKAHVGQMFVLDQQDLYQCYLHRDWSIRHYCSDSIASILRIAVTDVGWDKGNGLPILGQFSDETDSFAQSSDDMMWRANPRIPHIKKIRFALPRESLESLINPADAGYRSNCLHGRREPPKGMRTLQPIIWLLNIDRHFKYSRDVPYYDMPWHKKIDGAVFRGLLTGLEYNKQASDEENCENLIRCKLAYAMAGSKLVDAKLTSTFDKVPEMLRGVNLTGSSLRKEEILAYKGFIVVEGNDVSSGLKWAMVSKSVVLMPPPRFTSWSMEELLEPWVHYIPINRDLSDVEEKVLWMLQHQAESQRISHRSTLFLLDLFYHPDAMKDNRKINAEVLRRYAAHFRMKQDNYLKQH